MAESKRQAESEAPAKVWQVDALAQKIDTIEALIRSQNTTYPTRTELKLELQKRDSRIADISKTLKNYNRIVWLFGVAVVGLVANLIQTFLQNLGRNS